MTTVVQADAKTRFTLRLLTSSQSSSRRRIQYILFIIKKMEVSMRNQKQHAHGHQTNLTKHQAPRTPCLNRRGRRGFGTLVEATFRELGCEVEFAFDIHAAQHKISSGRADIIILDWMLNSPCECRSYTRAGYSFVGKIQAPASSFANYYPFQRLDAAQVRLPESLFYTHADHWQKPLRRQDLARKTS